MLFSKLIQGIQWNTSKKKILRLPEVISRTGYKRSNIYQFMNLGDFPKSVQLGPRAVAWLSSEIDQWIDDRVKERDQKLSIESSIGQ